MVCPPRPPPEQPSTLLDEEIVPFSETVPSEETNVMVPLVAVVLMFRAPAGVVPVELMVVIPPLTEAEPLAEMFIAP